MTCNAKPHRDLHVVTSNETLSNSCCGPTCPNWQVARNAHFFAERELLAAHDLHSKRSEKAGPRGVAHNATAGASDDHPKSATVALDELARLFQIEGD